MFYSSDAERGACSYPGRAVTDTGKGKDMMRLREAVKQQGCSRRNGRKNRYFFPPNCSGGYLLIRARAIYSSQEERWQNTGHSGWCRLLFLPSGRHVVSLSYAVTQSKQIALGPAAFQFRWTFCSLRCFSRYLSTAGWRGTQAQHQPP